MPKIDLTPEEKTWLAQHPNIVLGSATGYPPLLIKEANGNHVGVIVDLFEQINRQLNSNIRLHIEDAWGDVQAKAENREIDGLAFGASDPNREALYNQTDVLIPTYFSVFARSQNDYDLKRFSDLEGMRIGYKRDARPTRSLLQSLPSAILKPYESHESMTQALLSKEIDVIVAWISYDFWRIDKLQGTIDKILLIDEHSIEMVSHIRKDWPELIPILNKAIAALRPNELLQITNKWFVQWPQASTRNKQPYIALTDEERAWLDRDHTVRARVSYWPPLMFKEPELSGIAVDYLRTISERVGINVQFVPDETGFQEGLQDLMGENTHYDLFLSLKRTPEREDEIAFTDDYISMPWVIYSRGDAAFISSMVDLSDKTVSVEQGFFMADTLEKQYPFIRLLKVPDSLDALRAVATAQADAYIGNLSNASWLLREHNLDNLKIAAPTPFGNIDNAMGVRSDWPELASILSKGLASISPDEQKAIKDRWLTTYKTEIDYTLLWQAMAGVCVILFFVVFWNKQLSRKVRIRTTELSESEAKYRDLVDNSLVGIFNSSPDGRFIFVNDALARMYDFDGPEQMLAESSWSRWVDPKQREQLVSNLREHGSVSSFEAETITATGRRIHVLFSVKLQGEVVAGMVMDITERRWAEKQILADQERLRALASELVFVEERERKRIARDLHDGAAQSLALARMQLAEVIEAVAGSAPGNVLDEASGQIRRAVEQIREILLDLSSPALHEMGLAAGVSEWLEDNVRDKYGLKTVFHDECGTVDLADEMRLFLFRNVCELLTNVVKHGQAEKVSVSMARVGQTLRIVIEDDGLGFDPTSAGKLSDRRRGFGLFSVAERMADLGGSLEMDSAPGKGCRATLVAPLESTVQRVAQ
jgi:PAS domain S-box-containing protein